MCRVHLLWYSHSRLGANGSILAIASLAEDTIDSLVITHLETTAVARATSPIMASVPCTSHTITNLPFFLIGTDFDDIADVFVAETFDRSAWYLLAMGR